MKSASSEQPAGGRHVVVEQLPDSLTPEIMETLSKFRGDLDTLVVDVREYQEWAREEPSLEPISATPNVHEHLIKRGMNPEHVSQLARIAHVVVRLMDTRRPIEAEGATDEDMASIFTDVIIDNVITGARRLTRGARRSLRANKPEADKVDALVEIAQNIGRTDFVPLLDAETFGSYVEQVVGIKERFELWLDGVGRDETLSLWYDILAVDKDQPLETAKLVAFIDLYRAAAVRELQLYAMSRIWAEKPDWHEKIGNNPALAQLDTASFLMRFIEGESSGMMSRYMKGYYAAHVKGLLRRVPKHIEQSAALVMNAAKLYTAGHEAQKAHTILLGQKTFAHEVLTTALDSYVRKGFERTAEILADLDGRMRDYLREKDTEDSWLTALIVDKYVSTVLDDLLSRLDESGLSIGQDLVTLLAPWRDMPLHRLVEEVGLEEDLRLLREEAEKLRGEKAAIDEHYRYKAAKARQNSLALPLSHALAKRLGERGEAYDDYTLRNLACLVRGVYARQKAAGPEKWAYQYLTDAKAIREINDKLRFVDSGAESGSELQNALRLLDEIIDAGVLDNLDSKIVDESLLEFVFAYIEVRDRVFQAELPMPAEAEAEDADGPTIDLREPSIPWRVVGQAEYEELFVFPPSTSAGEIIREYIKNVGTPPEVQWQRIENLVDLRDELQQNGIEARLIRTANTSWHSLPFFVLEISPAGSERAVAVVEIPVYGNATYVIRESDLVPEWRELVELSRQEARVLGAHTRVHSTSINHHKKKILDTIISELSISR